MKIFIGIGGLHVVLIGILESPKKDNKMRKYHSDLESEPSTSCQHRSQIENLHSPLTHPNRFSTQPQFPPEDFSPPEDFPSPGDIHEDESGQDSETGHNHESQIPLLNLQTWQILLPISPYFR